jgi:hypothetical protein
MAIWQALAARGYPAEPTTARVLEVQQGAIWERRPDLE